MIKRILDHLRKRERSLARLARLRTRRSLCKAPLEIRPSGVRRRREKGDVSARDVCPRLHEALGVYLPHGPGASWSSGRREPALRAQLARSAGRSGPCRGRPKKEVRIPKRKRAYGK